MTATRWAIWAWAVGGVILILVQAVVRLTPMALEIFDGTLTALHWAAVVVWTAFMLYTEAWRGFHLRFSPRVVVRAAGIAADPVWWRVLLAPIVAMGLLYATRRRYIASWILLIGIVILVVFVRMLPHPWRAIVDVGVVAGLAAGTLSVLWFAIGYVRGRPPEVPAEFP